MPRGRPKTTASFLLLDTKKKSYEEYPDKRALAEELKRLVDKGVKLDQLRVVPNKALAFELEYSVSVRQRKAKAR